jgi:hypothetical protein
MLPGYPSESSGLPLFYNKEHKLAGQGLFFLFSGWVTIYPLGCLPAGEKKHFE